MAEFWPTADRDPASPRFVAEFAPIWREMPKIVFSSTLVEAGWNSTVVREVVPEEIQKLKAGSGGDLLLGGAALAATFMRLGLIDEYRIYVHPVVIGRGRPLFQPDLRIGLRLAETRAFGNGVVLLRYERSA
jgi:dihydrofolate reductase